MIAEYREVLEKTIGLAAQRAAARERYEAENGPKKWGVCLPEEKALNDYLLTLEREPVEVLEAIMLLGRNEEYREAEKSPEENYLNLRKKRYHRYPDQIAAVYYLTGKGPLKEYLEKGLDYLSIVL